MYYFVDKEKHCQICTCRVWFFFTILVFIKNVNILVFIHFCDGIERCQTKYKNYWIILVFCDHWKMMSDLNKTYSDLKSYKMSDFVSFPFLGFILVMKLRYFGSESHWNTLIFFDKRRYGVIFEYVPWKNVRFCFISIVWVYFSHRTEKFRFWKSLK